MRYLLLLLMCSLSTSYMVFDFNKYSNLNKWRVVNDDVMGGVSTASFSLDIENNAVFKGEVSLDNNGGFASVQGDVGTVLVKQYTKLKIRLKGDGKQYQVRIKANRNEDHSYISHFSTSADWEDIVVPLNEMYPSYRGRKLDIPNFSNDYFERVSFLIANKKEEQFCLTIDSIELE